MFFDELNDFANRLEVFNFRIRNFYVESIFDGHDKINNSKGICVQILNQVGILGDSEGSTLSSSAIISITFSRTI